MNRQKGEWYTFGGNRPCPEKITLVIIIIREYIVVEILLNVCDKFIMGRLFCLYFIIGLNFHLIDSNNLIRLWIVLNDVCFVSKKNYSNNIFSNYFLK